MFVLIVSGAVCTGKTKVARAIGKRYNLKYVDVNKLIKENKLYDSYDRGLKSYVVDIDKLNEFLIRYIKNSKKGLVIDSHLSHYLDKKYVDLCVVVKCDISVLKKRLEKRKYSKLKIRENLDGEIFDVCLVEAKENGHRIKVIDSSNGIKKKDLYISQLE